MEELNAGTPFLHMTFTHEYMIRVDGNSLPPHLQVVVRVPVAVEDHDRVGGGEVDAEPARPRRQQEHRDRVRGGRGGGVVESVDTALALGPWKRERSVGSRGISVEGQV